MLFNEPKLLKFPALACRRRRALGVSVLFNEPKLLKLVSDSRDVALLDSFSALQRAEIAEIDARLNGRNVVDPSFSALQRAEIAEIPNVC